MYIIWPCLLLHPHLYHSSSYSLSPATLTSFLFFQYANHVCQVFAMAVISAENLCTARISMAYSLPHYLSSLTECKLLEDKNFLSLLWHTVNAKQISDIVERVNKWHVSIKILSKTAVFALEEGCNMVSFLHVGFVLLEGNHTAHTTLNNSVWE